MTKESTSRTASEIKRMAQAYATRVSPYPQDKGATYDTATYKAFEAGYRAALKDHRLGIRREKKTTDGVSTPTSATNIYN